MPTTIAIEAKPVILSGVTTPYEHLYLVKRVTDSSGIVLDERVIRGNLASNGNLETQVNIPLAQSEDARGSASLAQRHHTVIDLGERDPNEVWNIMAQHATNIDKAELQYGVEAYGFVDYGGEINSNTTVASVLHSVGINLALNLPTGIEPKDVPLYTRLDAMFVDDALFGGDQNDIIFGGVGNDAIKGDDGDDRIFGEQGNDALIGATGNDLLDGGVGADLMNGGVGSDTYRVDSAGDRLIETRVGSAGGIDLVQTAVSYNLASRADFAGVEGLVLGGTHSLYAKGNALANQISGNVGANFLSGAGGDDLLKGGRGDDNLIGGEGNDILRADSGNDHLTGGVGRDMLIGGAGSDIFVFNRTYESKAGLDTRDLIADFGTADTVDLHAIDADTTVAGNQEFDFVGSNAFTAAGQVRFEVAASGYTIVQVNVNNDLGPDFEIVLRGSTRALTTGDFIL